MSRQITHEEVKKHASQQSSWIIIHHGVYDVTKFLDEHPGGADSLLEYAGQDGTQAFEDVAHSEDAREMMKQYKIGTIEGASPDNDQGGNRRQCNDCCEPKKVPKKTWRNFDGGTARSGEGGGGSGRGGCVSDSSSRGASGGGSRGGSGGCGGPSLPGGMKACGHCIAPTAPGPCGVCTGGPPTSKEPRTEPHTKSIIVPIADSNSTLKWALIALAGAIIIGIAIKKYRG